MTEKTFIANNIPAPYRLPLFEELDDEVDLKVFFFKAEKEGRKWNPSLKDYTFENKTLPMLNLKAVWIHYTYPFKLLKEKPDSVIIGEYFFNFPSIFFTLLYSKITGAEAVLWSGSLETEYSKSDRGFLRNIYSRIRDLSQRAIYQFADAYIAYCEEAKNYLVERGASEEDIYTGGQVVPEELLPESEVKKQNTKYQDQKVILSLGYLQERKGIEYLIEAFKNLDLENLVLVIAGSGPDEERLKQIAGEEKDIEFVGYVEGGEKAKYYSIADIFVFPTLHDPWGLVVNEALYYGNPVVVTEAAGAKDMIENGKNGRIVPPKNSESIRSSIEETLNILDELKIEETGTSVGEGLKPFKEILKYD